MYVKETPFGNIEAFGDEMAVCVKITLTDDHMGRVEGLNCLPGIDTIELPGQEAREARMEMTIHFDTHGQGHALLCRMTGDDVRLYLLALNDCWDSHYSAGYRIDTALAVARRRLIADCVAV